MQRLANSHKTLLVSASKRSGEAGFSMHIAVKRPQDASSIESMTIENGQTSSFLGVPLGRHPIKMRQEVERMNSMGH